MPCAVHMQLSFLDPVLMYRRCMAEILPLRPKTLYNQSINVLMFSMGCLRPQPDAYFRTWYNLMGSMNVCTVKCRGSVQTRERGYNLSYPFNMDNPIGHFINQKLQKGRRNENNRCPS